MKKIVLVILIAFTAVAFSNATPVTVSNTTSSENVFQTRKKVAHKTHLKKHHPKKKHHHKKRVVKRVK